MIPRLIVFLLVALAVLARPASASTSAHEFSCDGAKLGWLRAAAAETALRVEPVACYLVATRVRLLPDGAPPLDVAIEEPPGPAFARAGRLRVSPIVEVDDYLKLPGPQRAAFEKLLAWLRAHHEDVAFGRAFERSGGPKRFLDVDAPLLVVAAVLLAALAWPKKMPIRGREVLLATALTAAAVALRLSLGAWAPHHVNGHGVLWMRALCGGADAVTRYGPGYFELFPRAICHQRWPPDTVVFAVDAALTATVPAQLYAISRLLGAPPRAALVAGFAAMLDPVSIRFAATESYFAQIVPLLALATLLVTASARLALDDRRVRALLWALAAGLVAAQAARVHPVSWIPIALTPAIAFAVGGAEVSLRRRLGITALAAAIVGGAVLATSLSSIRVTLQMAMGQGYVRTNVEPRQMAVLAGAALVVAALAASRRASLVPAALHVAVMVASHGIYGQSALWQMTYDRLFLAVPLVVAVSMLPPSFVSRGAHFFAASAAALALLVGARWPVVVGRTAQQLEYRWLRAALSAVPAGCRIVYARRGDRGVDVPEYATSAGRDGRLEVIAVTHADEVDSLLRDGHCTWFTHTTACADSGVRGLCDEIERRGAYEPVATTTVPPVEQRRGEFASDTPDLVIGLGPLRAAPRDHGP